MEPSFHYAEVRNDTSTNDTLCENIHIIDGYGFDFKFIFEGVLLTTVTVFGLASNTVAVIVLLRPKMRSPFHTLLVYLSVFDIVYLVMSQAIFGFPSISEQYQQSVYPVILPICFGIGHIGRVGSVYLTMSVTIERYFAIVHPLRYFGWKRALAPLSILVAVAYNVPKFFEFRYDFDEGRVKQSTLRANPVYITYYIFWSKFILVEVIPYFTIILLNSLIMGKIYKSTRFQKRYRYQSTIRGRQYRGREVNEEPEVSRGCKNFKSGRPRLQSKELDCRWAEADADGGPWTKKGLEPERRRKHLVVRHGHSATTCAETTFCHPEHQQKDETEARVAPASPNWAENLRHNDRCGRQHTVLASTSQSQVREESPCSRQLRENNLAGVLVFISLLFILCQSAKIVPDLYEVIYCRWGAEEDDCPITAFIERVVSFSHFLLAFNSSVNFVIYTWRGTRFRAELFVLFGSRAHSPPARSAAGARRGPVPFRSTRSCSNMATTLTTNCGSGTAIDEGDESIVFYGTPETRL